MLISYVFSFRNEENNLRELVSRINKVTKDEINLDYELIFVNDDSNDRSLEILCDLQTKYNIKIINMSKVFGGPACIMAGLAHSSGDICITLDSDLQDPPELIPLMLEKYNEGYDIVHTVRTKRLGEPKIKMAFTKLAYKIIKIASDVKIVENSGDFRLMSKRVVEEIKKIDEYDPFFPALTIWVGFKQFYLPYIRMPRFSGETQFGLFSRAPVNHFLRAMLTDSKLLIHLLLLIGSITLISSILITIYAIFIKFLGLAAHGVAGMLIVISFFSGLNMMGIGIVGLYLLRIYDQVKGRPRYIIKEILMKSKK